MLTAISKGCIIIPKATRAGVSALSTTGLSNRAGNVFEVRSVESGVRSLMKSFEENTVRYKSKKFAVRIVKLYQYLTVDKKEYVLSKQVLRSGTSIELIWLKVSAP